MKHSNFNTQLKYEPNMHAETHHRRQCNVIWYNPPYSKNVKTNITWDFLQLIDKHFPPNNKLHKLFNRHPIHVSYSCSENMKTFIIRHNTILKRHYNQEKPSYTKNTQLCNCRNPEQCPVKGICLQTSVPYKARVTTTDNIETKIYIGVTGNDFQTRYQNHCKSLNNEKYLNKTEL